MTELKTLKDLDFVETRDYDDYPKTYKNIPEFLKQEAIKHIKALELIKFKTHNQLEAGICTAKIDWINLFFNITEEDLK